MIRKFDGDTLVVASHNKGKVREIAALLGPYVAHFRSAAELDLPEPEETGDTFIANAELKARAAAAACGLIALSDDSGLVVPGIGGQPGIYSARCAGPGKDFSAGSNRSTITISINSTRPVSSGVWATAASRHRSCRSGPRVPPVPRNAGMRRSAGCHSSRRSARAPYCRRRTPGIAWCDGRPTSRSSCRRSGRSGSRR